MSRRYLFVLAVVGALGVSAAWASTTALDRLAEARGELIRASREYRASLERLLPFQAEAARRAAATAEQRRALLADGLVSRREVEETEAVAAAAVEALARTRAGLAEADRVVAEAEAAELLAVLPPPAPGESRESPARIYHFGPGPWSLAMVPQVEQFFESRFGRVLPVSALGQTALHGQLGLDHRNAMDVAVHPDSAEGQAVMAWLRERGIPFLAFRGPVPGASTGAHVHIGEASPRLVARP
jgi:hypothetical protein